MASNMAKNCVIVGVGPGNGASFARRFASAGYQVAMLSRNETYLKRLSSEISGSSPIYCDACDPASIRQAFDRVHEVLGAVDVMIYNAGAGDWNAVEDTLLENFESSWKANAFGLLAAAQQVIPAMKERSRGSIVVIGATASLRGSANAAGFAAAKSAQRSLAQSMARGLGPTGIHVSYVVIDGVIDLERTRAVMTDRPDEFFLKPDAIAESVYNLTEQHRSAWSFEIDLRPHVEKW
jgi:short-subunit dehydrogenase